MEIREAEDSDAELISGIVHLVAQIVQWTAHYLGEVRWPGRSNHEDDPDLRIVEGLLHGWPDPLKVSVETLENAGRATPWLRRRV